VENLELTSSKQAVSTSWVINLLTADRACRIWDLQTEIAGWPGFKSGSMSTKTKHDMEIPRQGEISYLEQIMKRSGVSDYAILKQAISVMTKQKNI